MRFGKKEPVGFIYALSGPLNSKVFTGAEVAVLNTVFTVKISARSCYVKYICYMRVKYVLMLNQYLTTRD